MIKRISAGDCSKRDSLEHLHSSPTDAVRKPRPTCSLNWTLKFSDSTSISATSKLLFFYFFYFTSPLPLQRLFLKIMIFLLHSHYESRGREFFASKTKIEETNRAGLSKFFLSVRLIKFRFGAGVRADRNSEFHSTNRWISKIRSRVCSISICSSVMDHFECTCSRVTIQRVWNSLVSFVETLSLCACFTFNKRLIRWNFSRVINFQLALKSVLFVLLLSSLLKEKVF